MQSCLPLPALPPVASSSVHCQVLTLANQVDDASKVEKLYSYATTAGEDTRAFGTGQSAPPTPRRSSRFRTPSFFDADSEDAAIIDANSPRAAISREHSYAFGKLRQPSPVKDPLDLGQISKVAPALSRLQDLVRGRRAQMLVSSGSSSELHPLPAQRFASASPRLNGSFAESSGTVATEVGSNAAMDATSMPGPPKSFLDSPEAEFPVLVVVAPEVPGEAAIIVDSQEASALQPDSVLYSALARSADLGQDALDEIATPAPPSAEAESRAIPGLNAAAKLCALSSVEPVAGTLTPAKRAAGRLPPPIREPQGVARRPLSTRRPSASLQGATGPASQAVVRPAGSSESPRPAVSPRQAKLVSPGGSPRPGLALETSPNARKMQVSRKRFPPGSAT